MTQIMPLKKPAADDKKGASKQKSVNRNKKTTAPELVFTVSRSQVVVSFSDRTLQIQQHKIVAKQRVCRYPNVPTLAA